MTPHTHDAYRAQIARLTRERDDLRALLLRWSAAIVWTARPDIQKLRQDTNAALDSDGAR